MSDEKKKNGEIPQQRKVKENDSKRKTLQRKLVVSSDSESGVEVDVLDTVSSSSKKMGEKRCL